MNREIPEGPLEILPEYRIRGCTNFDELFFVLRDLGEIRGSRKTYPAETLIKAIQSVVQMRSEGMGAVETGLEYITNSLGIRDKVRELIRNSAA